MDGTDGTRSSDLAAADPDPLPGPGAVAAVRHPMPGGPVVGPGDGSASGMGPVERGPDFAPAGRASGFISGSSGLGRPATSTEWSLEPRLGPADAPLAAGAAVSRDPRPRPAARRDPAGRRANLISVAAILLVVLVTAVGTAIARYSDTHIAARPSVTVPVGPAQTVDPSQTEFNTATGTGRLVLLSRTWHAGGREPATHGSYLELRVKIICDTGDVGYDPYNFQAFDATGELYDVAAFGASGKLLGVGELHPGQTVTGSVAFDLPRGDVMLLMSDGSDHSVTALKVPD